jgi:hypothetical protein
MKIKQILATLSCVVAIVGSIPKTAFAEPRAGGNLRFNCFNSPITGKQGYWTYQADPGTSLTTHNFDVEGTFSNSSEKFFKIHIPPTANTINGQTTIGFPLDLYLKMTGTTMTTTGLHVVFPPLISRCS